MREIILPPETDYIGIYLTNRCFLSCPYCITNQLDKFINAAEFNELTPQQWLVALNRLRPPQGVPITFEGGEPFLYKRIWELLENVEQKIDILTALPPNVTVQKFKELKNLDWNKRECPYPTIRVSFHEGQNDYKELIRRIKELQEILSIGLFHIEHPQYPQLTEEIRAYAKKEGVEFRTKAFLGNFEGNVYGEFKYPEACQGQPARAHVQCKNSVFPIAPNGDIYRCHSDLYARRKEGVIGNITDEDLCMEFRYTDCDHYGLCSPCDVKIKTNHLQQFGYTSVNVIFDDEKT